MRLARQKDSAPATKHPLDDQCDLLPASKCRKVMRSRNSQDDAFDLPKHRAVVFDLDETAGTWGLGSLAYKMCLKFTGKAPPIDVFLRFYFERGGARPWLRQLLKTLEEWKRFGRIDEVGIFTAASNKDGWVTYLKECMEEYAHTPGLFQSCITREGSPLAATKSGMRTVKDLSLISPDAEHVVLIDDKPEYALNGYVIGVPEYTQDVCITELKAWMKTAIPHIADLIESVFAEDEAAHPPNAIDFSKDDALWNAAQVLSTIFPEPEIRPSALSNKPEDDQKDGFSPRNLVSVKIPNQFQIEPRDDIIVDELGHELRLGPFQNEKWLATNQDSFMVVGQLVA